MTNASDTLNLIQLVEQASSPAQLVAAVEALTAAQSEAAIPTLIKVLGYNNPEAAAAAIEGLVKLGGVAVPHLLEQLDDYNYGARAYSFRALAAIADPRAFEVLLAAAETDFAPSVRRAAAKGLGNLNWHQLPAEQREPAQDRTLAILTQLAQDPEWAIRYAAVAGLQSLASPKSMPSPKLTAKILVWFDQMLQQDTDLAIKARVLMAQQQLGAITSQQPRNHYQLTADN